MTQRKIDWFYSSPTNFQYDELNRVTMDEQGTNGSIGRSHYSYDSNSRETATWRDEQGSKGERFSYNPTNQLTAVSYDADQVWTSAPQNASRTVGYNYTPTCSTAAA